MRAWNQYCGEDACFEYYGCVLLSQLATDVGTPFTPAIGNICRSIKIGHPVPFSASYSLVYGTYAMYRTIVGTSADALALPGSTIELVHDIELDSTNLASDLLVGCYVVPG